MFVHQNHRDDEIKKEQENRLRTVRNIFMLPFPLDVLGLVGYLKYRAGLDNKKDTSIEEILYLSPKQIQE